MRRIPALILLLAGCNPITNKGLFDTGAIPPDVDNDGDGYSANQGDCDDRNDSIHPGAAEACDAVDQDCNGLTREPDADTLLAEEASFMTTMTSPNKGLPLDSLTCDGAAYNPEFWILPQLQYAIIDIGGEGCSSDEIQLTMNGGNEEGWGLFVLDAIAAPSADCPAPAVRMEAKADLSRYQQLRIRYQWGGDEPITVQIEHGDGETDKAWELPPTDGAWNEEELTLAEASDVDLARWGALELVLPEAGSLTLDYTIVEADPETWQSNEIDCCRGEETDPAGCDGEDEHPDMACLEPYTSSTNLGVAASQAAISYHLEIERDQALAFIDSLVAFLEETPGWKGEEPGESWTPGGFVQSWMSPFSGAPSPDDKMLTLIQHGTLVAGLIAAREALREDEPALSERIQALLDDMDWTQFSTATGFMRVEGCGLATGAWVSEDCPHDTREYQNVLVGDDTLLSSFLLRAFGGWDDEDWTGLDCTLRSFPEDDPVWWWYAASAGEPSSAIPLLGAGGLYMPWVALLFLDSDRIPVDSSHPLLAEAATDGLLAQHSLAGAGGLWSWGSARSVDDCSYKGGAESVDPAPYNAFMGVEYAAEPVSELACTLEEVGLNRSFSTGNRVWDWGYRDAIRDDGAFNEQGFIYPHKGWTWLAWAQHGHGPVLRELFAAHPTIATAYETLPELCVGQGDTGR